MIGNLLQVDSSIIEKNLSIVEKDPLDMAIDSILQNRPTKPNTATKLVTLLPGFCIKTRYSNSNEKVFINICHTDKLPKARKITERQLMEILKSDEPSSYRIPMTVGNCREEKDKQDRDCKVYDIAVHPEFYDQTNNSSVFKDFLIMLVFESIENKFDVALDREFCVILQNRKCVGKLPKHEIVQRPVEDGVNRSEKKSILIEEMLSDSTKKLEMPYRLFFENNDHSTLFGQFHLPDIKKGKEKEIQLDIGEDRIIVESKQYFLDIFVPVSIKDGVSIKAVFDDVSQMIFSQLQTYIDLDKKIHNFFGKAILNFFK